MAGALRIVAAMTGVVSLAAGAFGETRRSGGELVPEAVQVDALAASHQTLHVRAPEAKVPQQGSLQDLIPGADAGHGRWWVCGQSRLPTPTGEDLVGEGILLLSGDVRLSVAGNWRGAAQQTSAPCARRNGTCSASTLAMLLGPSVRNALTPIGEAEPTLEKPLGWNCVAPERSHDSAEVV